MVKEPVNDEIIPIDDDFADFWKSLFCPLFTVFFEEGFLRAEFIYLRSGLTKRLNWEVTGYLIIWYQLPILQMPKRAVNRRNQIR